MNLSKETLYLKIEQNSVLQKPDVTIKDVGKIECENKEIKAKVNQIRLYKFDASAKAKKRQEQTFSVLKVIELIHKEYPQLTITNVGEPDFVVHYVRVPEHIMLQVMKAAFICVTMFFGAAFMIVTFCKEVSITRVLDSFYTQVMGIEPSGPTVLDICFCLGLPLGVLIFYNHLGKKKLTNDPTPVQVAMRKYEQDVDMTIIETRSREGKSMDVD
ncbi:MAG: stage V sporulation protein AA [Eubacterium sp.]|nr:stage V sporulation protein AA [Eubacterium sp.]